MPKIFAPLNNFDGLAPTTTKGDTIARDTTANVRVAVGVDGTFYQANSGSTGGVRWAAPSAMPVNTLTGATTLPATAQRLLISGTTFAITLPSATSNSGLEYEFIKTDSISTAMSVVGTGFVGVTLSTKGENYKVVCDGTTFWPTSHGINAAPNSLALTTFGFGAIGTSLTASWTRVGSRIHMNGRFNPGGAPSGASLGTVCLPPGLLTAGTSFYTSTGNNVIGVAASNGVTAGMIALTSTGTSAVIFGIQNFTNPIAGVVGSTLVGGAGTSFVFDFSAVISGWGD